MAEEHQEGQKTVVSFIVGLLIGGLLVWTFSGPAETRKDEPKETTKEVTDTTTEATETTNEVTTTTNESTEPVATLSVGDGSVTIASEVAVGLVVPVESATYPVAEGWIGVRDYVEGQLGGLLGVVRFSAEQNLVPSEIVLQRALVAGNQYAVVIYSEDGDRTFNLAQDSQIDGIMATFKAK